MLLSVVIPVYNEAGSIARLLGELRANLAGLDYEIILVNDGSSDGSLAHMRREKERDPHLRILNLSRNFGHQIAITAGVDHARGDAVAVMDADLQDPPALLPQMVAKIQEGYDVVYGRRRSRRGEGSFKLATAALFYRLMKRITRIEIPVDTGDFRMMSRRAVEGLLQLREAHRFVRGLVSWVGYRQTGIEYERRERFAGETKYPLRAMFKFAWDGVTSFSLLPLKMASWLGLVSLAVGVGYSLFVFYANISGRVYLVRGWSSLMIAILFFSGVQLLILGILGEYIGRIAEEVKRRPLYLVDRFEE